MILNPKFGAPWIILKYVLSLEEKGAHSLRWGYAVT
jgi:hypothetical protein